jgi:hypothetical protein
MPPGMYKPRFYALPYVPCAMPFISGRRLCGRADAGEKMNSAYEANGARN